MPALEKIRVLVAGAAGRMGKETVAAVSKEGDLALVGAVDRQNLGEDAGAVAGINPNGVSINPNLQSVIQSKKPQVMVDFTRYDAAAEHAKICLENKVACVIGTTGFNESHLKAFARLSETHQTPVLIAPNFAIGAVLLMKFAKEASKYFAWGEIIELHHEKKLDSPSGTAIRTAQLMLENRPNFEKQSFEKQSGEEKITGSRGGEMNGIRLHSVRLPGLLAHQEVLFGGFGQVLSLRHDSLSRESFMPGVILAIRKIGGRKGLIIGLENILE